MLLSHPSACLRKLYAAYTQFIAKVQQGAVYAETICSINVTRQENFDLQLASNILWACAIWLSQVCHLITSYKVLHKYALLPAKRFLLLYGSIPVLFLIAFNVTAALHSGPVSQDRVGSQTMV